MSKTSQKNKKLKLDSFRSKKKCGCLIYGCLTCKTLHPRFRGENLDMNKHIYGRIESIAKKHSCTPAQLALAWIVQQGSNVVPIPGTTKIKNLDQNLGALVLKLSEMDLKEISEAVPIDQVAGGRSYNGMNSLSWKFADTPPKESRTST